VERNQKKKTQVNLTRSLCDQIKATMNTYVLTIYAALLEHNGIEDLPYHYPITDRDCLKHIPYIIADLKALLPQRCSVKHAIMARGSDGKLYDIEELDDTTLPLVDMALEESYIVIDWLW